MKIGNKKITGSELISNVLLLIISACCVIPFILIISISLTTDTSIIEYGYRLIPKELSFSAYKLIFNNPGQIINAYKITILISIIGTILNMIVTSMFAYAIARKVVFERGLAFMVVFTGMFGGGLVPTFILMTRYLHLQNSIWAIVFSHLGNIWFIFLMKAFFVDLPEALYDSAKIDGAGDFKIFISIVIPLSKPVFATISLFTVLGYWNEWFNTMLYITDDSLYTLQYLLQRILRNTIFLKENMDKMPASMLGDMKFPEDSLRMAMVILAAGPMLIIFPFFQKYFVKGLSLGAVKG